MRLSQGITKHDQRLYGNSLQWATFHSAEGMFFAGIYFGSDFLAGIFSAGIFVAGIFVVGISTDSPTQ